MSWLFTWIIDTLQSLGLITRQKTVLFIGLDNAGKSTLLFFLHDTLLPEDRIPLAKDVGLEGVHFLDWDLGGMPYPGQRWYNQKDAINGIVFMVDASDHERMEEARQCLGCVLRQEKTATVPIVVLGNKIDKPGALAEAELVKALDVQYLRTGKRSALPKRRPFEVFMCSVLRLQGHKEALGWIAQFL